ncbi:MAG TPA: hypothetical protein VLC09_20435 [Polyangiaceae bacterium]|nr:hypothetical protein [Polyangiaceae bacterium]
MVARLIVHPARGPLRGSVRLPADERILLARLALGALSRGKSTYVGAGSGRATETLLSALARFGVASERSGDDVSLRGAALGDWTPCSETLDLRGEARVAALLLGLLVARPFESELWVDATVADTLGEMLEACGLVRVQRENEGARLLLLASSERPEGIAVQTSGAFPWVKQALLLLGLRAATPTTVEETWLSEDHLERALLRVRAPLHVEGTSVTLHPPRDADALAPTQWEAVGSVELGDWLGAAALLVPGSRIELRGVGTNPTRTDFFNLVRLLGGPVGFTPQGEAQGEPFGNMSFGTVPFGTVPFEGESAVESAELSGAALVARLRRADLAGEPVLRLGESAAPLAVLLAGAEGTSSLSDLVACSRSAEPRWFSRVIGFLRSAGIEAAPSEVGLVVKGRAGPLSAFRLTSGGDPRLVFLGCLLALRADGPCYIDDVDCLREVFPRFIGTWRALGASLELEREP